MTEQVTEEDWGMNFLDGFGKIVQEMPDQTAIVDMGGARSTTYRELDEKSRQAAAKLFKEMGDVSGRAVLVCMDRRMEYVAAEIGILMAGAAYVPLLPDYPKERITYIQKDCEAAGIIDAAWMEDIDRYEPVDEVKASDEGRAMLVYTSGSTGRPKGIVHTCQLFCWSYEEYTGFWVWTEGAHGGNGASVLCCHIV